MPDHYDRALEGRAAALDVVPREGALVRDFRTGVALDVTSATTEELAEYLSTASDVHREVGEAEKIVNDELLARMDRDLSWTQTVGSGARGFQFELHTSSPSAGTDHYDTDELQRALDGLVSAHVISGEGAAKALDRRVFLELGIAWSVDPDAMVAQLRRASQIEIAGQPAEVRSVEVKRKARMAGINALRRIAGAVQGLDRAHRTVDPPSRRVKVTVKGPSK